MVLDEIERGSNHILVSQETKKAIKIIATIRNKTMTEVAEEYFKKGGLQEECREILRLNGWNRNEKRKM